MSKVNKESVNVLDENISRLRQLFPQVFTEGKINFAKLEEQVSGIIDDSDEKYMFSWAGRSDAIKNIQTTSKATLVPEKDESVNFENTENIFIEGENLEVLKLLQKSYSGKIKMIYIDPPYNTGNDFVYKDDFSNNMESYLEQTGQSKDGIKLTTNPETSGRFHSDWISMMYPRLFIARNLLSEDGVIFISIDDNEVHNLRIIMNEIFGEENFIDCLIWKKRYGGGAKEKYLVTLHEYVFFYAKNKGDIDPIFIPYDEEVVKKYYKQKDEKFNIRGPYRTHPLEAGKAMGDRKNLIFPILMPDGTKILPKRQWLWSKERVDSALKNKELEFSKGQNGWTVNTKQYLKDENGEIRMGKSFSIIENVYSQHGTNEIIDLFGNARIFPYPKPTGFMKPLLEIGLNMEGFILDFFAGSGTTAHTVLDMNKEDGGKRKFICVQLQEQTPVDSEPRKAGYQTIADITKERIRRVIKKIIEENKQQKLLESKMDLGFKVFKLSKSNYKIWQDVKNTDKLKEQLKLFEDPLIQNYKDLDVIYEIIIKEGYSLNSKIEETKLKTNKVYKITDDDFFFYICLDKQIKKDSKINLNLDKNTLFVCLDSALDDTMKTNLNLLCKLKTI